MLANDVHELRLSCACVPKGVATMNFLSAIKNMLKRILPPPVKSFMREVDNLNDSIWRSKSELDVGISRIDRRAAWLSNRANQIYELQTRLYEQSDKQFDEQAARLERLYDLFEAANSENLRLYFDAQKERETLQATYSEHFCMLSQRMSDMANIAEELSRLCRCVDESKVIIGDKIREELSALNAELLLTRARIDADNQRIAGLTQRVLTRQDELLDPRLYAHAVKMWYQNQTGKPIDLDNPVTYNEKIQWLKIYDNNPLKTVLADKVAVRRWVAEKIGDDYLIPILGIFEQAKEIDFDELPNQFVLKASHGSGWNIVVRDKDTVDLEAIREKASVWLRKNFAFVNGYELHYSSIPRRLLVEQYICNSNGDLPDYKFWCFHGSVHYIEYLADRQTMLKVVFFTRDWERAGFTNDHSDYTKVVPKPDNLDEMIAIAEKLACGFPHVRVDLYLLDDGSIKFGEMTFSSSSGIARWNPPATDEMLGKLINLPV